MGFQQPYVMGSGAMGMPMYQQPMMMQPNMMMQQPMMQQPNMMMGQPQMGYGQQPMMGQ